jgi:hypothetical protein
MCMMVVVSPPRLVYYSAGRVQYVYDGSGVSTPSHVLYTAGREQFVYVGSGVTTPSSVQLIV